MSNARKIASHTAIYGVGQAVRGLASFIMLPIYTTHLTPADYGVVELLNVVLDLTTLIIGSRVSVGIFKYYSEAENSVSKRQVLSTAFILLFFANLFGVAALLSVGGRLSDWLATPAGFETALRVFAFTLIFRALNEVFYSYLRALDRAIAYVSANFLKLFLQLALNIIFIVYMGMGYWGIIWASLISSVIMTVIFGFWLMPGIGLSFSRHYARKLVTFSLPIIFSSFAMYYITFGDRYFLKHFQTIEIVGIYALAYKFGFMLFSLVWGPFSTYWSARQFDYARQADATQLFGQVFFYVNTILLTAAAGIMVLTPPFLHISANQDYWPALEVIPWIVCAYVLQCWTDFIRFGIFHAAKTRYIAYGTFLTAALITVLYLYWIPREGAVGAAKATLVAFVVRFSYIYMASQRFFRIHIPWVRLMVVAGYLAIVTFLLRQWALPDWWALGIKSVVLVLAVAVFLAGPVVSRDHRQLVLNSVLRMLNRAHGGAR